MGTHAAICHSGISAVSGTRDPPRGRTGRSGLGRWNRSSSSPMFRRRIRRASCAQSSGTRAAEHARECGSNPSHAKRNRIILWAPQIQRGPRRRLRPRSDLSQRPYSSPGARCSGLNFLRVTFTQVANVNFITTTATSNFHPTPPIHQGQGTSQQCQHLPKFQPPTTPNR